MQKFNLKNIIIHLLYKNQYNYLYYFNFKILIFFIQIILKIKKLKLKKNQIIYINIKKNSLFQSIPLIIINKKL